MGEQKMAQTPIGMIVERRVTEAEWSEMERRISSVEGAFPDGPEKHRDYHQAKINAAKEEAEFWKAAKLELTKIGVSSLFGVLKIVVGLALLGALFKLGGAGAAVSFLGGGK